VGGRRRSGTRRRKKPRTARGNAAHERQAGNKRPDAHHQPRPRTRRQGTNARNATASVAHERAPHPEAPDHLIKPKTILQNIIFLRKSHCIFRKSFSDKVYFADIANPATGTAPRPHRRRPPERSGQNRGRGGARRTAMSEPAPTRPTFLSRRRRRSPPAGGYARSAGL